MDEQQKRVIKYLKNNMGNVPQTQLAEYFSGDPELIPLATADAIYRLAKDGYMYSEEGRYFLSQKGMESETD